MEEKLWLKDIVECHDCANCSTCFAYYEGKETVDCNGYQEKPS